MVDVSNLVGALNASGFFFFVPVGATVPDPSYGNDGQYAYQPSTGAYWLKTGGLWVASSSPVSGYGGTSATSTLIAIGSSAFTTQAGLAYNGARVRATSQANHANYLEGLATYSGTTLTIVADLIGGSGTFTDWYFAVAGNFTPGYGGSSSTSFAIATGSKAFTGVSTSLAYQVGNYVRSSSAAGGANFMEGTVTAYSGGTLTINVTKVGGSGTHTDWNFSVSGAPGTGDLLSTNNLSDVTAKYTAMDNISIHGADIASASTVNLETATGNLVDITGTTAITVMTLNEGHQRTVRFTGVLTLTNGSSLVLPGGGNISTAAGDYAVFVGYAAGVVRCTDYSRASAGPIVLNSSSTRRVTGLTGIRHATTTTRVDLGADLISFINPTTGQTFVESAVAAIACDTATAGPTAGGRDQSAAFANGSQVNFFFIRKDDGTKSLVGSLATATSGPVLPTGYTSWCYASTVILSNGTVTMPLVIFRGCKVHFAARPNLINNNAATTESGVSMGLFVPTNALTAFLNYLTTDAAGAAGSYTSTVRVVTGLDFFVCTTYLSGSAVNAGDSGSFEIPSVSATLFFLNSNANIGLSLWLTGYTIPNGDS